MATSDPSGTGSRQSQDYVLDGNDGSRSQSPLPSQSQSQSQSQAQSEQQQQQQPTAVSLLLTNVKRSNKNTTTTSHKRRRLTWQEQRHDYFQRLHHSCSKQLHQQIKRIKQMETAKCARRIKRQHIKQQQQQEQQQQPQQQQRLQAWKNLSLGQVVTHIVLHCLGLHRLQPPPLVSVSEETEAKCSLVRPSSTTSAQHGDHRNQYDEKEHEIGDDDKQLLHRHRYRDLSDPGNNIEHVDDDDDDKKDRNKSDARNNQSASSQGDNKINTSITTATDKEIWPSSIQFDPEQDHCIQIILQHKYMAECLERWNKEIANYQHWCWKLQQQQQDRDHGRQTAKSRHLATTTATIGARHSRASAQGDDDNRRDGINRQQHDSSSSLSRKRFKGGETVDFTKSLFVSLGGDSGVASMEAEDDRYEPSVANDHDGDDDDFDNPDDPYLARILHHSDNGTTGMAKKKNRQGQRARRAKAMVLQSKQDRHGNHNTDNYIKKRGGAMPTPSLNWRSSKKNQQQQQQQHIQRRSQINKDDDQLPHQQDHYHHQSAITAATSTTMTTTRTGISRRDPVRTSTGMTRVTTTMNHHRDEHTNTAKVNDKVAALHPSWEAKKAQPKPTIVTFQGKKITFDDNDE